MHRIAVDSFGIYYNQLWFYTHSLPGRNAVQIPAPDSIPKLLNGSVYSENSLEIVKTASSIIKSSRPTRLLVSQRAHDPGLLVGLQLAEDPLGIGPGHHQHGPQAQVEGAGHLLLAQAPGLLQPGEHGRDTPTSGI